MSWQSLHQRFEIPAGWVIPSAWVVLTLTFLPVFSAIQFGGDEHFNLVQVQLWRLGKLPYADFWTDQPPGLPLILLFLEKLFGSATGAGRVFSLLCSAMILYLVPKLSGAKTALGVFSAQCALLLTPIFELLSVSVMQEVPAVCFVLAFLVVADRAVKKGSCVLTIFAIALFLVSVSIKLIVLCYLPLLLLLCSNQNLPHQATRRSSAVLVILSIAAAITAVVMIIFFSDLRRLLIEPHVIVNAKSVYGLSPLALKPSVGDFHGLEAAAVGSFLALCAMAIFKDRLIAFLAIAAIVTASFLLMMRPFWDFYVLHFAVMCALLCGRGGDIIMRQFSIVHSAPGPRFGLSLIKSVVMVLYVIAVTVSLKTAVGTFGRLRDRPNVKDSEAMKYLRTQGMIGKTVVEPGSMYLLWAGGRFDTRLALLPLKRYWSGGISHQDVQQHLSISDVACIVVPLGAMSSEWASFLGHSYRSKFFNEGIVVFEKEGIAVQSGIQPSVSENVLN